jgi:mono/diheme cytochrome c family protein
MLSMSSVASSRFWSLFSQGVFLVVGVVALAGCQRASSPEIAQAVTTPHIVASNPVEAGRYLAIVGGCNDCHTEGYLQNEGKIPEADWLAGSALGWRGPWGTTYPPNLRLRVQEITEDAWVTTLHTRTAMPPMPWMNVNQMAEEDARALYQYIRSLGAKGEPMPAAVPPDQEPTTPYLSLAPVMPAQ